MPISHRFLILGALLLASVVRAQPLEIEIREGALGAMPIAVVPFDQSQAGGAGMDVAEVIASDLRLSGRFKLLPDASMPAQPRDLAEVEFGAWRSLGMEAMVVGSVVPLSPGRVEVAFQLLDVPKGEQIIGYRVPTEVGGLRRAAHHVSDMIYQALTGERGAFSTQVAFVTASRGASGAQYSLKIADADGYDPQIILSSPEPIMSPAWSPDGRRLAYVSFENGPSQVFVQEIASGRRESVSSLPGINGAPAWSPDGQRLALTLSKGENPDIYVLTLATRDLRRLTDHYAIDTEPTWAPDGRSIVFTSDRGGRPQLYRVSATGGEPQRLSYEGAYNAGADFSPDGKEIALVHGDGRSFRIAVLDPRTGAIRELSRGPLDESPSFAPNARMIIYASREGGRSVLAAVSVDGQVRNTLGVHEGDVREPAWSPYLD